MSDEDLTTEIETEDGKRWLSSDGKEYKSRSGAWKRSKKLLEEKEEPQVEESQEEVQDDTPIWSTYDYGDIVDEVSPTETVPTILKTIKPAAVAKGKLSKKEAAAKKSMNKSILTVGYRTGDHLMTGYRRAMLEDPKATAIVHSDSDYNWISEVTNEALEDSGVSVSDMVGTGTIAVVANAHWFGVPLYKIHQESEKSPFKGRVGGAFGRFLRRLPIIGKRIKAKEEVELFNGVKSNDNN
tara:strand:- start:875 stop:1594 length:720 start_codon:yes stop_codon:yes gene_type:complete